MSEIQRLADLQIPLETIKQATNDFSQQHFIVEGGFGNVYKGTLPHPSNELVAVKRLHEKHGQGQTEFMKEIIMLSRYQHDNIVSLLGFCDENGEKILVYKHEVNGSLDKHLADTGLTWEQRLKICLDAARGLKYLHDDVGVDHRVIHRDVKSSNILLDENWKAKISDFGFCKLGLRNEEISFLVTNAAGTIGYVDPEYMETGVLSKESDVYSFGVVLCEVLCGRLALIPRYDDKRALLPLLVRRHFEDKSLDVIVFPSLRGHIKIHSLEAYSLIAYYSLNKDRRQRPTMGAVVKGLEAAIERQLALEPLSTPVISPVQELNYLQIPFQTIEVATNYFYHQNFLGEGGFGKVYKGKLPHPSNEEVVVKRLHKKVGHGQNEFLKEIVTLASYKHDNIVSLLGFCDENDEKVVVYKHEVNGSLDMHLADVDLSWEKRLQICLDAARGLRYLHDDVGEGQRVIHRNIKSSNILLDENWKAKISDFELCKIGPINDEQLSAAGTMEYMDPQYMETGILTKESDVYAFGVVLCEVLCGKVAMIARYGDHERTFLPHLLIRRHYKERNLEEKIVSSNLQGHMKPRSLETFSRIAYNCVNKDRRHRPTMKTVVKELEAAMEHQTGQRIKLWGATSSGDLWSFMVDKNQKIVKITIDHHTWIHSISFTKKDLDGTLHTSPTYGGSRDINGGWISEINFDDNEDITGISGTVGTHYGLKLVSSVCFMTNKRKYGPFGTQADMSFLKTWGVGSFTGFYGRSGWELDAIGCCFTLKEDNLNKSCVMCLR